jgi:hypothetical protein
MNKQQFESELLRAETMRRLATEPTAADFYTGYIRGLNRKYHGEQFGTAEEHELWMSLAESDDASLAAQGRGYLGALDSTDEGIQEVRNERAERTLRITNGSETREVEVFYTDDGLLFLHDMADTNYECCEPLPDDSDTSIIDVYSMMATDPSQTAPLLVASTWRIVR